MQEFSGKSYTIYYFMRYDVAYLGKVRKIVDGRDRTVASYRYDKMSGNVVRIRDMADNDINFSYYKDGNLKLISRRGANEDEPRGVTSFDYDNKNNPVEINTLNSDGKVAFSTRIAYNSSNQITQISNGQNQSIISYTKFGYPESSSSLLGNKSYMMYDNYNRLEKMVPVLITA